MLFPKAPTSCGKQIWKQLLLHCTSICMSPKSVSKIFKILFQTGDINIFITIFDIYSTIFAKYSKLI